MYKENQKRKVEEFAGALLSKRDKEEKKKNRLRSFDFSFIRSLQSSSLGIKYLSHVLINLTLKLTINNCLVFFIYF